MDETVATFGSILCDARKRHGLKMAELAEKLHVTRFTIRNWEGNISKPDYETLVCLSEMLDVPIQDFFPMRCDLTDSERQLIYDFRRIRVEARSTAAAIIKTIADLEGEDDEKNPNAVQANF